MGLISPHMMGLLLHSMYVTANKALIFMNVFVIILLNYLMQHIAGKYLFVIKLMAGHY